MADHPRHGMDRRRFLTTSALAAAALPLSGIRVATAAAPTRRAGRPGQVLPAPLNPGDTIALVSPSGMTVDPFSLQVEKESMEALGLKVKLMPHAGARHGHLAGTDDERAGDFNAAFADREVKAVICTRGGSGAARILPLLDYALIRRNPKVMLGFSDITALHCALNARAGLVTFHGPGGASSWNRFNADQFRRVFFARELMQYRNDDDKGDELVQRANRTVTLHGGKAQGELVGGNLAVLTALAGSPYLPDFAGKVLFLEDVSEAPYRVDRMFSTLKLMGALDRIAGFIFGECTDCKPGDGYGSLSLPEILEHYIAPLKVPAYRGAMIGHIRQQFIVPVGGRVALDADAGTFRMLEPVFGA